MSCVWYFRLIISLCLSGYVLCLCRAGWKYHAGMCFYFSDEKKSWYEAAVNCRTHRSSLVVVNTHDINTFVVNQINRHGGSYWTDGTDDFQEGEWEWPSSGQLFNFTNWYHGQPDNQHSQGEDCLAIHAQLSSTWFDDQCILKQKYVCYESCCCLLDVYVKRRCDKWDDCHSIQDGGFVIG